MSALGRERTLWATLVPVVLVAALVMVVPMASASSTVRGVLDDATAYQSISAGGSHSCGLLPTGRVKCWGENAIGQLGLGDTVKRGDQAGEMGNNLPTVDLGSGRTAIAVSAGYNHTCALLDDHTVKCWGYNIDGQLGLGDTATRGDTAGEMGDNLPAVDLGTGRTAVAISSGRGNRTSTCALLDDHTVKCWGYNLYGQLGQGDTSARGDQPGEMGDNLHAVDLGTGRTATSVTLGGSHACALLDDHTVKCWGRNERGQLGQGDTVWRGDQPGEMGDNLLAVDLGHAVDLTPRTATAITTGFAHSCAILDDDTVKCWGGNWDGQLGQGHASNRGDEPDEMGNQLQVTALGTGRIAATIVGGGEHTCAVLDNDSTKCWGSAQYGRLGLSGGNRGDNANEMGDNLPAVALGTGRTAIGIALGEYHTCARLDDVSMKCWGYNFDGQLGQGDTTNRGGSAGQMGDGLAAIDLGTPLSVHIVADQAIVAPGGVIAYHIAITNESDGSLTGMSVVDTAAPDCGQAVPDLAAGQQHIIDCSTATTGADFPVYANTATVDSDQTGPSVSNQVNVSVGYRFSASTVATGGGDLDGHGCALLSDATLRCWGGNGRGQLGVGDTNDRGDEPGEMGNALVPVDLGTGRTVSAISSYGWASGGHKCVILDTGTVKCWGNNLLGQLGLGDTANRGDGPGEMGDNLPAVDLGTGRTATAIATGMQHSCALLDNGTVKCWGWNYYGQLGYAHNDNLGNQPGEMGDSLPAVDLGTGRTATAITTGGPFTCALLDNHTVKCWGQNALGQLGVGDTANRGDGPGEMGDNLPPLDLGSGRTATALTAGNDLVCAVLDDGSVKCWGGAASGQLGQGDNNRRGDQPGEMGDNLHPVDLGTGRTATTVVAGGSFVCALLDNATVKCWGDNTHGQLGMAATGNRGDQPGEMGDNLGAVKLGFGRTVSAIAANGSESAQACAVLDDHTVKCWGSAEAGQLGQGDQVVRGDELGEMADNLPAIDLGHGIHAPSGSIAGTATEAGSVAPVAGAWVAVLRTSDFSVAGGAVTDNSGNYTATVALGSYYLYVIDPTGEHTSSFFGPPTTVTVTSGNTADADPVLARTRGAVTGTIVEDGTGNPISGAWAIGINAATGAPETGALANGSGQYTLPGLIAGNHLMVYVDPAGGHTSEFYANSSDAAHANPVAVTAGGSTVANDSMATQTVTPTGAALSGTVTETATNTPLGGVAVMALRAADYRLARATSTNASGQYNLDLQAGDYKLVFLDGTGRHNTEWHNNHPYYGLADADSVTAPAATNAVLDPNTGSMAGTITDDPAATPIAGAWVIAIGPAGIAGGATTAANGTYALAGLPAGTYRAAFIDPTGNHLLEYYNNAPSYAGATPFNITAGNTTTINAALAHP